MGWGGEWWCGWVLVGVGSAWLLALSFTLHPHNITPLLIPPHPSSHPYLYRGERKPSSRFRPPLVPSYLNVFEKFVAEMTLTVGKRR